MSTIVKHAVIIKTDSTDYYTYYCNEVDRWGYEHFEEDGSFDSTNEQVLVEATDFTGQELLSAHNPFNTQVSVWDSTTSDFISMDRY